MAGEITIEVLKALIFGALNYGRTHGLTDEQMDEQLNAARLKFYISDPNDLPDV